MRSKAYSLSGALAALCFSAISAFAQPSQPATPYLVFIPENGAPDIAPMGSQVRLYGRNFCPPNCSSVTLTIGNDIVAPRLITTVPVNSDGTFATTFTMQVPFAWRYLITASQTTPTGAVLSATVPVNVPQGDSEPQSNINAPQRPPNNASPAPKAAIQKKQPQIAPKANVHVGGVTEFPPNISFDGRTVAVDVSKSNNAVAIAASESGGLWKTTDTGVTWAPLTGLPTFRMSDVKMAPSNDQIVIATAWADSHAVNSGGIWRSTNGGSTWQKPPTADPTPGFRCPTLFVAWGISFAPGTNDVFVGTDCGVSVSHDLGATWSHVVPDATSLNYAVYSLVAQSGGSGTIVDTCSADGHHRSTNGGTTWTPTSASLPGCPFIGVHNIAVSPLEPNVLFAAIDNNSLYESDNAGVSWTNLNPAQGASRSPWVATHVSADGNPNHFDIYFGSGLNTIRQTCTNTGGPGLRCSTTWNPVTLDHADQNGLAFSTSSNCAQYIVSDGGVHTTSDCGANWHITGNGTAGGYNALQVYEMNGEVHPAGTDLYFGTQDNNLWASGDNGVTWPNNVCCEGFYIQTPHASPSSAGQTITFVACSGCSNLKSGAVFTSVGNWNNPPGGGGNPFVVDQKIYLQWSAPSPPTNQLYITVDTGATWSAVSGASTTLQLADHIFIAGPPANPTVYQEVIRPGNKVGLIKITGVRSGSATITNADTGLNNIGFWSMGQGTFRFAQVLAVDPNNALHLIAADIGLNQMMVSTDGGASWNPDVQLTNLVTNFGQFQFGQPSTTYPGLTTEAHSIAFDPSNGNRILVGTEQAGIMESTDGGATWGVILGSSTIPAVSSFFFDEVQKDVLASSYGRGLWKLDLSQLVVFPPKITKTFAGATTPLNGFVQLTFNILNQNATTGLTGVGFTDTLPSGLVVSTPNGLTGSCGGGTITANSTTGSITLTNASLGTLASCTFSVNVTGTTGGLKNNSVTVSSTNGGTGNTSMASVIVVLPPTITKVFAPTIIQVGNTSTLTFTITNPNTIPGTTLNGVGFTDSLPGGLIVSAPSGTCDGGTLTATSGSSVTQLSGASLAPSGICTFSVSVTGTAPGILNNTTGPVMSIEGGSGSPGLATVTVLLPPTITKSFADSQVELFFGSTALSFTVTNPAANPIPLTGIAFTDTLPGSPPGLIVSTPDNGLLGSCDGGTITAVPASNNISLSGATLAPGVSCTFSVRVNGAAIGVQNNMTSAITAGPGGLVGIPAKATTTVVATEFLWFFLESGGGGASH